MPKTPTAMRFSKETLNAIGRLKEKTGLNTTQISELGIALLDVKFTDYEKFYEFGVANGFEKANAQVLYAKNAELYGLITKHLLEMGKKFEGTTLELRLKKVAEND